MKKYFSELIGTFVLVFMGCGTAMLVGCDAASGGGYILTALAFGLSVVAMAYSVGNISGGHFNATVTLAMLIRKKISGKDAVWYILFQLVGAFLASGLLVILFDMGKVTDLTGGLGSNGLDGVGGNAIAGLIVEAVLTFIFVMTILGVTSEKFSHGSFAGLIIGLTLAFVHIFGIGLTGTSVNPSRSFGPAIVSAIKGNATPISNLWVFVAGPFAGAILAALIYAALEKKKEKSDS